MLAVRRSGVSFWGGRQSSWFWQVDPRKEDMEEDVEGQAWGSAGVEVELGGGGDWG